MSTYRELTYFILDGIKNVSDDSHIQEEHVLYLIDKLRVTLLKQRYSDIRKEIPESNYQTICVDLLPSGNSEICSTQTLLKSNQTIPFMMQIASPQISTDGDFFTTNFSYVTNGRFKYAGKSKYSSGIIYCTIAPDNHLYMKGTNPQFIYLNKAKITGIFEDSITAAQMRCGRGNNDCEYLDDRFPLEESLVTPLIEMAIKELSMVKYQAEDNINNSNDDLSTIANYIRQQLADGRRSDLYKNP